MYVCRTWSVAQPRQQSVGHNTSARRTVFLSVSLINRSLILSRFGSSHCLPPCHIHLLAKHANQSKSLSPRLCFYSCLCFVIPFRDTYPNRPPPTPPFNTRLPTKEYLRSLQRVMIRFHLEAFSGEYVGDVALELYRECECVLFVLICTTCSGGQEGDSMRCGSMEGDDSSGSDSQGSRCARVHPDYHTVLRRNDVGVFIGASQKV